MAMNEKLKKLETPLEWVEKLMEVIRKERTDTNLQITELKEDYMTKEAHAGFNESLTDQIKALEKKFDTRITTIGKGHEGDIEDIDKEIAELKERTKTLVDLEIYDAGQIKALETKISIIAEIIQPKDFKLHFNFREQIASLQEQLNELEKKYDNRTHLNLNRVRNNEEVLQELINGLEIRRIIFFGFRDKLLEKLDSSKQTDKIPIGDDLMRRITSHESVPMDKSKYKKASGGEKPMEYSSMDGGELIHIASPKDSKPPELKCPSCNGRLRFEEDGRWFVCVDCKECFAETDYRLKEKPKAEPEKSIGKTNAYYKGYEDCEKKLVEDAIKDLDELIDWSKWLPVDSEICIRLKRKKDKWQGMQKLEEIKDVEEI